MSILLSLLHRTGRAQNAWRRLTARLSGTVVGRDVEIGRGCEIALRRSPSRNGRITIGDQSRLDTGVLLHSYQGAISLGRNVFIGPGSIIYGHGGVEIGDDCLIAMHCRILSSEHAMPPLNRRIRWEPDILKPTRIGRDVWLGAGVTVLGGVTIGDGCVVGAGSVVTKDLPPGTISVGSPARVVGHRPAPTGMSSP